MEKSNRSRHKKTKVKPRNRQRFGQDAISRAPKFSKMPHTFKVALEFRNSSEVSLSSGVNWNRICGLFYFLGQVPLYAQQLYQLYRYARIYRVDVEAEVNAVPGGSAYGFDFSIGSLPWDEMSTTPISPDAVAVTTGAVHAKGGLYGGKALTLRKSFDSSHALGNPIYSPSVWQTYAQAVTAPATADSSPIAVIALAATPSVGTINLSATLTYRYHVEFFNLDTTPVVTSQKNQHAEEFLDASIIEKTPVKLASKPHCLLFK